MKKHATSRRVKLLANSTNEGQYYQEPLLAFSFYLSGKNNLLLSTKDEILDCLDNGFSNKPFDMKFITHASALMWFWTLGAYEIVRTMCQAKNCFSDEFNGELIRLKKLLSKVRMPSAKMEKECRRPPKIPVNSNRSPDGWDIEKKDLLIGDPENYVRARDVLNCYDNVMSRLELDDVKCPHYTSY